MARLHKDALGLLNSTVMGIAGTAPSFSISATMAALIGTMGVLAPATLLYCGLSMMGITVAYMFLNRIEANAGAAYAWVTLAFNSTLGFLAGWTLMVSSSLFMISATIPAARATLLLCAPAYAEEQVVLSIVAIGWLAAVTCIVVRGIAVAGFFQLIMTTVEIGVLLTVMVVAFWRFGLNGAHSIMFHHFLPSSFSLSSFVAGSLIALFLFWGWDVALNLNEETVHSQKIPGMGALFSMLANTMVFVAFAIVVLLVLPDAEIADSTTNILFAVADKLFPRPYSYIAIIALMLSTVGTIETSTLQFTRTLYAQSRAGLCPPIFTHLHPLWKTPYWATYLVCLIGALLLLVSLFSKNVNSMMQDSMNAIGVQAAFYYGLAALACVWHFRREWCKSLRWFILAAVWPLFSTMLLWSMSFLAALEFNMLTNIFAIGGILSGLIPWGISRRKHLYEHSISRLL